MRQKISFALGASFTAALLLAGCGGGGGGGGGGGIGFPPIPTPTVTLTGTATYESVPNKTGGLVYGEIAAKPVRGAYVEVLDAAGNPVANATTTTDDNGAYSVQAPANANVIVRVRAQLTRAGAGPTWDVSIRDNTQGGAMYSMQSSAFATGGAALTRDLRAATGWGGSSYTGPRVAAPFAVLDTVYTAMQKVVSVAPATAFPALKVFWSVNNAPSAGDPASGQIGTTFFTNKSTGREIYVLGKEDTDTDEFDSPVIAHEWGHYYQSSFSRDDSPGGPHSLGDRVDRRLAFSEGWGNGWSGIALNRSNYVDSKDARQATGDNINLAAGPTTNPGWYRESSIHSIFWNLNQQIGFKPIHDAMTSVFFRAGAPVTSIHPFTAAFNQVNPGSASALVTLLTAQNISAASNDPYGDAETNAGGTPTVPNVVQPMYKVAAVGGAVTQICVSSVAGSYNKLGNFAYLRFTTLATKDYRFSVTAGGAGNPDYDIYRAGNVPRSGDRISNLPAGDYVMAVTDLNNTSACFNITIQ